VEGSTDSFMARQQTWVTDWPANAGEWRGDSGASLSAFHFGSVPPALEGTADAAFFPRVLHNLARFQAVGEGDYLDIALAETYRVLKPGGIMGVVQHHARDEMPDEWATGANGYLKKQFVIEQMESAGFEFVAESDINANEKDQPTTDDFVWRLPPSLATSSGNEALRARYLAIGESNRMTLKFRKPY
jgi:predicted methyltransferase